MGAVPIPKRDSDTNGGLLSRFLLNFSHHGPMKKQSKILRSLRLKFEFDAVVRSRALKHIHELPYPMTALKFLMEKIENPKCC